MPDKFQEVNGVLIAAIVVFFVLTVAFVRVMYSFQKRKLIHLKELSDAQRAFSEALLQSQLEIQEQTLKNISQEIHDNVGQVLSLAKLNLNMMDIEEPGQLRKRIDSTLTQVTKAINDLRDLSRSFNTDNIVSLGLIQSIAAEVDIIAKAESHKTAFRITGNSVLLEPQKELILFRIVQEAMHNIIKHANAKCLQIHAEYATAQLELKIEDDGNGFDLEPLNQPNNKDYGLGIRNMYSRAKLIGADFSMRSTPGSGTVVKIIVPLDRTAKHW